MTERTPHRLIGVLALMVGIAAACVTAQPLDVPPLEQPTPELPKGSLTDEELRVIDLALATMMADRSDLGFRKDYIDDPFRLTVVQRALDEPLSLIEWNYGWDDFLLTEKTADEILARAAVDLDCSAEVDLVPLERESGRQNTSLRPVPTEWRAPLGRLDDAVFMAKKAMIEKVLASLTEKDLSFLASYLLCHFSHDEPEGCPEVVAYTGHPQFLDAMRKFDLASLIGTARALSLEVDAFVEAVFGIASEWPLKKPLVIQGRCGKIVIGTAGDDSWNMAKLAGPAILIDPSGNDYYNGPVGAAGNLAGEANPIVSVSIDFSGNDCYSAPGSRSFGSGALGIAHHVDVAGDDIYRSGMFSQGSGVFGVGILADKAGNDIYEADALVQGAGAIGVGLLMDSRGFDTYRGAIYAQGFGYIRGFGLLTERHGYDCYYAGGRYDSYPTWGQFLISMSQGYGFGSRSAASGGIGILHDRDGKDYYNAEVFSQGGSYWFAIGALIDDNGNDHYQSEVYSQGAGVHLSTGILLDRAGNDTYSSLHQAQGFAHDLSVGWLIDEGGEDQYSGIRNAQGVAVTNSVAGLIDRSGSDSYICRDMNRGTTYRGITRGYGNIGFLIDMSGADAYADPFASNGGWWEYGNWAVGIDVGDDWWVVETDEEGKELSRTLVIPEVTK